TQLLSKDGFIVECKDEDGNNTQESFKLRQFQKDFFSPATNQLFCKIFLENALRDPISGEIGKSIIFAVSQPHAIELVQILNEIADRMFPNKYQSDFAVQVTSQIPDAQQFTINFANNNLRGSANFLPTYKTSKARICVTVGMMTTGYDCPDLLNLGLFRPIFSPTDFIQIKGRGTRKHNFLGELFDPEIREGVGQPEKTTFKLFDFFANCEYFEEEFKYDQAIKLPQVRKNISENRVDYRVERIASYEHLGADILASIKEEVIGVEGMKIDRLFYEKFEQTIRADVTIVRAVESGLWQEVIDYVNQKFLNDPNEFYSLEKLRKAASVDRRLELREILEKIGSLGMKVISCAYGSQDASTARI
ncbi:MAG: hypothetical protein ACKO5Q_21965, partial [Microcystaceae cyanobacterium]